MGPLNGPLHVTEAHYHTFTLPPGVELLAAGQAYANQAFRHGPKDYGVQLHPDCSRAIFNRWQDADWAPYGKPGAQTREEQDRLLDLHDAAQAEWLEGFLTRLEMASPRR